MTDVRDLLIRGSEKIIEHYRFLLANAKHENERDFYRTGIEQEQRLLDQLQGASKDRSAA